MILGIEDFSTPWFNPQLDKFQSSTVDDELLENAGLDPGLILQNLAVDPRLIGIYGAQQALGDILWQQQFIVYDIASKVGVLGPFVDVTKDVLQSFDVNIGSLSISEIEGNAVTTVIGIGAQVLSAIPTIYTQIAGAVVGIGNRLLTLITKEQAHLATGLVPTQEFSKETDADQFNVNVRTVMGADFDWTSIFLPRFEGELSMQAREDRIGRIVTAWELGDGQIAYPDVSGKKYTLNDNGTFIPAGGLGFIPGGQRIYSVTQSSPTESPEGIQEGRGDRTAFYDPRCGSVRKADVFNVGSYYPTTAQASMSLWDFCFQRGAAMYTLNAYELLGAWQKYFASVYDGIQKLWGDEGIAKFYRNRWGCGYWENTLQGYASQYTYNANLDAIGVLSWAPYGTGPLKDRDADAFARESVFNNIIQPALAQLLQAQNHYLRKTTIAAYLPINGGVDADPTNQGKVMGAMKAHPLAKEFVDARKRILNGSGKYEVRLADVIDPVYRQQIEDAGGGTQAMEPKIVAKAPAPLVYTPKGGPGLNPPGAEGFGVSPAQQRRVWPYLAGGVGVTAAAALSYAYWDQIGRFYRQTRRRLPGGSR